MQKIDILLLEFDKKGALVKKEQLDEIHAALGTKTYTDLLVFSHGWNNNDAEALGLYAKLLELIEKELQGRDIGDKRFLAIGVIWPSKKFGDPDQAAASVEAIGGNGKLKTECRLLSGQFDDPLIKQQFSEIEALLSVKPKPERLAEKFGELFSALKVDLNEKSREEVFPSVDPGKLSMMFSDSGFWETVPPDAGAGGAASTNSKDMGGALSITGGIFGGIQNLFNMTTYYTMKARSGLIGREGLNPVLNGIKKEFPALGMHLIGHSFGARLVSSALLGSEITDQLHVDSLSLLQAAFSHFAFAKEYRNSLDGLFRAVVEKKLVGRVFIITHSRLDKAVGVAYAIASRVAGQIAEAVGDKDDPFGGLGGNGAQSTPEVDQLNLLPIGGDYSFSAGRVYNLKSEQFIFGHSDIKKPEVAQALVSAFMS